MARHEPGSGCWYLLTSKTVAKRCSFSGVGFLFQNHYPRFRGAPSSCLRTLTRRLSFGGFGLRKGGSSLAAAEEFSLFSSPGPAKAVERIASYGKITVNGSAGTAASYSTNFKRSVRSTKDDSYPSDGALIASALHSIHKYGAGGQAQARMRVTDYRCQSASCWQRYPAFYLCQQLVVEAYRIAQE